MALFYIRLEHKLLRQAVAGPVELCLDRNKNEQHVWLSLFISLWHYKIAELHSVYHKYIFGSCIQNLCNPSFHLKSILHHIFRSFEIAFSFLNKCYRMKWKCDLQPKQWFQRKRRMSLENQKRTSVRITTFCTAENVSWGKMNSKLLLSHEILEKGSL